MSKHFIKLATTKGKNRSSLVFAGWPRRCSSAKPSTTRKISPRRKSPTPPRGELSNVLLRLQTKNLPHFHPKHCQFQKNAACQPITYKKTTPFPFPLQHPIRSYHESAPPCPRAVQAHWQQIQLYESSFPDHCRPSKAELDRLDHIILGEPRIDAGDCTTTTATTTTAAAATDLDSTRMALSNFQRITGIPKPWVRQFWYFLADSTHVPLVTYWIQQRLLPWQGMKRGRDLFLPGLGGFHIPDILSSWIGRSRMSRPALLEGTNWTTFPYCSERQRRFIYSGMVRTDPNVVKQGFLGEDYHPFWLPTPADLHVEAYFPNLRQVTESNALVEKLKCVLRLESSSKNPNHNSNNNDDDDERTVRTALQRRYLLQYPKFWNDNPNCLEILLSDTVTSPEQYLFQNNNNHNHHHETSLPRRRVVDAGQPPPRLLPPRQLIPILDDALDYLVSLRDYSSSSSSKDGNGLLLRVLRTKRQIVQVGKALHNCLTKDPEEYFANVRNQRSILVALYQPTTTTTTVSGHNREQRTAPPTSSAVVAVGEYCLEHRSWNDMKEDSNADASPSTIAAFEMYAKTCIEPWLEKRRTQ